MIANKFNIGNQFRHKSTKDIWEVEELEGNNVFVNQLSGDVSNVLDEDLFDDMSYISTGNTIPPISKGK